MEEAALPFCPPLAVAPEADLELSLAESAAADWALFCLAPAGAFGREAARQAQQAQQAGAAAWHWHCGFRCADCACRAESCAKAHAARAAVNSNVERIFICLAFAGKLDIFQFPIREARPPNRNFCEILDICVRPLFRLSARCGFGARSAPARYLSCVYPAHVLRDSMFVRPRTRRLERVCSESARRLFDICSARIAGDKFLDRNFCRFKNIKMAFGARHKRLRSGCCAPLTRQSPQGKFL